MFRTSPAVLSNSCRLKLCLSFGLKQSSVVKISELQAAERVSVAQPLDLHTRMSSSTSGDGRKETPISEELNQSRGFRCPIRNRDSPTGRDLFRRQNESTPFRVHWFQGDTLSPQTRKRIFTRSSRKSVELFSFLVLNSW